MDRTRRIPVPLTGGDGLVRGINGHDLVVLSDQGAAPATQAIDLAVQLAGIDPGLSTWADVERVLLAGFAFGFDRRPELVGPCAACAETIEIAPDLLDILADPPEAEWVEDLEGWRIHGRPPTARAMEHAAHSAARAAADALRKAILVSVRDPVGNPQRAADIPAHLIDRALTHANAAGLLIFDVTCPACGAEAPMRLDPLRLLRSEAARAGNVAAIAAALSAQLGWSLSQVLDLPDSQRRALSRLVSEQAA